MIIIVTIDLSADDREREKRKLARRHAQPCVQVMCVTICDTSTRTGTHLIRRGPSQKRTGAQLELKLDQTDALDLAHVLPLARSNGVRVPHR